VGYLNSKSRLFGTKREGKEISVRGKFYTDLYWVSNKGKYKARGVIERLRRKIQTKKKEGVPTTNQKIKEERSNFRKKKVVGKKEEIRSPKSIQQGQPKDTAKRQQRKKKGGVPNPHQHKKGHLESTCGDPNKRKNDWTTSRGKNC